MIGRAPDMVCLAELDVMIARAEAACERYRQAAEVRGLTPPLARKRRALSQQMEEVLARLQMQRDRANNARAANQRISSTPCQGHSAKLPSLSGAAMLMFLHLPARSPN